MRRILFELLDPLAGTGYNAAELEQRYGWHAYPLDLQMRAFNTPRRSD